MNRRRKDKGKRIDASELVYCPRGSLLIDGYNLMHTTRFKPQRSGAGELRKSREGLLRLLSSHLPGRFATASIVFDSQLTSPKLPKEQWWEQLRVYFARDHASADDLIAELVRADTLPQRLVVVSSDHRVHLAATRRRATAVDSEPWIEALLCARPVPTSTAKGETNVRASPEDRIETELANEDWSELTAAGEITESIEQNTTENPFPDDHFDDLDDEFPGEL